MPRAGLTTDRVVDEAWALMISGEPLSLAAVAARVGVRVPSLYKHVSSLDALHQLVAVRAKTELGTAMADAVGADGAVAAAAGGASPSALVRLATAYRHWAAQHPGLYASTLRAPDPTDPADVDAGERAIRVVFTTLSSYGLPEEALIDATRAFRSAVHGYVALEAAGGFGLPVDVDRSFESMIRVFQGSLAGWEHAGA